MRLLTISTVALALAMSVPGFAHEGEEHDDVTEMIEEMRDAHAGHDHEHDFSAMEEMSEEEMHGAIDLLREIGLAMPPMDSHRGKELFMSTGCIICHQVRGVGGQIGPAFDAHDMPVPMNAFEFAARMWRGAPAMVLMQEDLLGELISLDGQDLADIIAFVHDDAVQHDVTADDIPERFRDMVE